MDAAPSPSAPTVPQVTPPGEEKFTVPVPPVFPAGEAWLSALSLLVFLAASVAAILGGGGNPWWVSLPFWVTAVGSGVGFVYETVLVLRGTPYQLFTTRAGRHVQVFRLANLAPVFGSAYLAYALATYGTSPQAWWLVLLTGAAAGYLLVLLLFRGPEQAVLGAVMVGLLAQLVLVWSGPDLAAGGWVRAALAAAAVLLFATTLVGTPTPRRSTGFHLLGAAVVGLLAWAWGAEFAARPAAADPVGTRVWLWLLAAVPAGGWAAFRLYPGTWAVFRSGLANLVWPLFYLVIAGGPRLAEPKRLSKLYAGREGELRPLPLFPYYLAHRRNLTHPVSIPCLDEALTVKVNALGFITQLVRFVFALASGVNRFFPFANVAVPIAYKPRMDPWSDGTEYWPFWFLRRVWLPRLGWFELQAGVKGPGFQPTPLTAVAAYRRGQLLAYLVEYGIAGALAGPVVRGGRPGLALDLSFLEGYETKPDYEPYGGAAFFEYDAGLKCLRLTDVRAPRSDREVAADPADPTFRHAEDMVLASVYFLVVSGKHLVEIHMGLNLVEVALFNSFDARGRFRHPVRLALYPHLFAHELAEELTTENLLEDRAVFPQIFATTNAALVRHLNDRFADYQLGRDEEFDRRERDLLAALPAGADLAAALPRCSLVWEKEYAAAWQEYADRLVGAAYPDDAAVEGDDCVRAFFKHLTAVFRRPLPDRYAGFATRAGLARFVADTMHHLIVRHEVYGTSGVRLALDPRINKVQVPKDGGTYAVDEWRSLAAVAMATSRVRYTLLMSDFSDAFQDLEDERVRAGYLAAYKGLNDRLAALEARFAGDGVDDDEVLRLRPSDLDIGAGY